MAFWSVDWWRLPRAKRKEETAKRCRPFDGSGRIIFLSVTCCGGIYKEWLRQAPRGSGIGDFASIVNKATCATINPTMGYDKYEFCDLASTAHKATATINRHIKIQALKPREKRGKHPGLNDDVYNRTAGYRNFRQKAKSEEERKMKVSTSDAKYRAKRMAQNEKKIEATFKLLQYPPIPWSMSCSLIMMMFYFFFWSCKICWLLVSNALGWCQWIRPLLSWLFIICPKTSKNEAIPSTCIPIFHLARRCQCSICITINFCRIVTNVIIICWNQHEKSGRIWENMNMKRSFIERFIIQQSLSMFIFNLREKSGWEWMSYWEKWEYFIWNDKRKIWEKSSWIRIEWCKRKLMRW